ncbi:hypothetical protein LTR35_004332 [Friedmanniomyces endolithicus]|nr:hypothetical protein LTS00_013729 [Friedmanniomyces endolithicus]KAK0286863.1 hypothetical protein LTR35_004332 [Friedmanniomyces endolithicus]
MSFPTAAWLALFCFLSHVTATAAPCLECEEGMEMPAPVIVTTTEPCCECGECEEMPMTTPAVFISTVSVCAATTPQSSIIPYTSGSSTYWISSCVPSTLWYTPSATTMWYTQNASVLTCAPETSVVYSTTTAPGSGSCLPPSTITLPATTSTASTIIYSNGTAPPAQTVTVISTQGYTTEVDFTSDVYTTLPGLTVTGSTTVISTTTSLTTGASDPSDKPQVPADCPLVTSTIVQTQTATTTTLSISPGPTSYATTTVGTQTVVSTLSVATALYPHQRLPKLFGSINRDCHNELASPGRDHDTIGVDCYGYGYCDGNERYYCDEY